jgi:peptidoglycan hydrolase-like protein with peptidoglycan-binding domain
MDEYMVKVWNETVKPTDKVYHLGDVVINRKALKILGQPAPKVTIAEENNDDVADDIGVLRRGCKGEGVKIMQKALGVTADGNFGPGTEKALKEWQAKNGLKADGIAGPATFAKLLD